MYTYVNVRTETTGSENVRNEIVKSKKSLFSLVVNFSFACILYIRHAIAHTHRHCINIECIFQPPYPYESRQ